MYRESRLRFLYEDTKRAFTVRFEIANSARGTSRFALVARLRGEFRSRYGICRIVSLYEMENSIPPHYTLTITH